MSTAFSSKFEGMHKICGKMLHNKYLVTYLFSHLLTRRAAACYWSLPCCHGM